MLDEKTRIVLPGDVIREKVNRNEAGIVREENNTKYAMVVGMVREGKFIPLEHVYVPKPGDPVVGVVSGERRGIGYVVDLNTYYPGLILSRGLRIKLPLSSQIFAKVARIESGGNIVLTDVKRLPMGRVVDVPAAKVPRIIGRDMAMLKIIKEKTGVDIYLGFNGYIWLGRRGDVAKAIKAIKAIVSKAHIKGLTDEITEMLSK